MNIERTGPLEGASLAVSLNPLMKRYNEFQSFLDFAVSLMLLLSTLTIKDRYKVHSTGIAAWIECRIWNSNLFLWAFLFSSTWNIVVLTIERSVQLFYFFAFTD